MVVCGHRNICSVGRRAWGQLIFISTHHEKSKNGGLKSGTGAITLWLVCNLNIWQDLFWECVYSIHLAPVFSKKSWDLTVVLIAAPWSSSCVAAFVIRRRSFCKRQHIVGKLSNTMSNFRLFRTRVWWQLQQQAVRVVSTFVI